MVPTKHQVIQGKQKSHARFEKREKSSAAGEKEAAYFGGRKGAFTKKKEGSIPSGGYVASHHKTGVHLRGKGACFLQGGGGKRSHDKTNTLSVKSS